MTSRRRIRATREGHLIGEGLKVEARHKHHADLGDPGPGLHLWTVMGMWRVNPAQFVGGQVMLDLENMLTLEGPGCFKCEQTWTADLADKPCTGSLELQ